VETDLDGTEIDPEILGELEGDGSAGRGQTQKEQLAVLSRFRTGETNIIVATCVGEEGLDIGEVDLIINYDAPSSPIRLLQRIGRTGRARRGKVFVFLAKDTREEESYKKAQREYKSVQAKIATGNNLMLRTDLSPPMLPPSLPSGAPARTEVHLTKEDIASADSAAAVVKATKGHAAAGSRARGGDRKLSVCEGIDAGDMTEFRALLLKYPAGSTPSADATSGQGARPELQRVVRLLERGVAWQASESPQFYVAHSNRSSMYRRIMTGIESARFDQDSDTNDSALGAQKSLFCMPGQSPLKAVGKPRAKTAAAVSKSAIAESAIAESVIAESVSPATKHKSAGSPANSRKRLAALAASDISDDDFDDVNTLLARPPSTKAAETRLKPRTAITNDDDIADHAIAINSSPFLEDQSESPRFFDSPTGVSRATLSPTSIKKVSTPTKSSKRRLTGNLTKSPASVQRTKGSGGAHQRRPSLQRNLFDTIDSLVKSGKAKPAFDWSMTLDTALLNEARTRGVDLQMTGGIKDNMPATPAPPPIRPSFFSGIGEPGAFDKLYDEDLIRAASAERVPLTGDLLVPAIETACPQAEQILCSGSDGEEFIDADILDEVENLSLADLGELECFTLPVMAVPETPPAMLMDGDEMDTVRAKPSPPRSVASVVCIEDDDDDDDIDAQLLAFDLDDAELFELSDGCNIVQPAGFVQDASVLPSSSPLRPRKRVPISARSSMLEGTDATPPLPSSSPVQRQGGRLVRGKQAARSASTGNVRPLDTPPRKLLKKPKLRQAPVRRAFNP
ncbi:3'-5' DNA helicase, partial [Coemansia aciculifera]